MEMLVIDKYRHLNFSFNEGVGGLIAENILTTASMVLREGLDKPVPAGSSYYYLLIGRGHSCFHKIKSEEIMHFYAGDACYIHAIDDQGNLTTSILGDPASSPNASFQVLVPKGHWFSQEPILKSSYTLMGLTMAPAFQEGDLEISNAEELSKQYPLHKKIIMRVGVLTDDIKTMD